jgi:hypothetical protein
MFRKFSAAAVMTALAILLAGPVRFALARDNLIGTAANLPEGQCKSVQPQEQNRVRRLQQQ